jgi:hypothetical protein
LALYSQTLLARPKTVGSGFNNAGTVGMRVEGRAYPEPPSSTATTRNSLITGIANMVFSF